MKLEEGRFIPTELEAVFRRELTTKDRKEAVERTGLSYSMIRDLSYGAATVTERNKKCVLALIEIVKEKLEARADEQLMMQQVAASKREKEQLEGWLRAEAEHV